MKNLLCVGAVLASVIAVSAVEPDAETRRWWGHVQALANDSMRGRDTGSPEHRKAQEYVVAHLQRQGLRPAGENGWYQPIALKRMRLQPQLSRAVLTRAGRQQPLRWLQHLVVAPATGLAPSVSGELVFAGSDNGASLDTAGRIVVRLNPVRLVEGPLQPAPPANAAAVIGIDSEAGPEPSRWPAQYSVSMVQADSDFPAARGPMNLRFNPAEADLLLAGTGYTYKQLVGLADAGRPVPSFPLNASLELAPVFETNTLSSDNVLGVLPGSDPALQREHVVVIAHIDGYGIGEPWGNDNIYNGAFDNAAYVATLLDFAEHLRERNVRLRRSLLVAVVTGEEKGLHGSRHFTQHPTVPREQLVAAINLDQLRPIFPLRTLTMHAIDESTLGDTARAVAGPMNIRLQADPEPLRNLLRRTDHWPFMQIGVPATSFIFGYEPGTPDEIEYRRWYREQYHTPLDDLNQPWVPEAAAKFNQFFERLVIAVANADDRPRWKPRSEFAPR